MKRFKTLTQAEQQTLLDASRYTPDSRFRQRAHAVYLSDKGYRLDQLAEIFAIDRDTASAWLTAWDRVGLMGLRDRAHPSRPRRDAEVDVVALLPVLAVKCYAGTLANADFHCRLAGGPVTAPWCLNQAMNGEAFKEYLRSQLGPTLKPGDIVICDNLPAHKAADVQALIEVRGATLKYLPSYSPNLNPIEQVFAKLKALLRNLSSG